MLVYVEHFLVGIIAAQHIGFMILEMFFWNKPAGRKIFKLDQEFASRSRGLAANQGLYNGFLAAGLVWGLWDLSMGTQLKIFFLVCVIVAGIYGAITVSRNIFWIQASPGVLALVLILYNSNF